MALGYAQCFLQHYREDFLAAAFFRLDFFAGTLAPLSLASLIPIAMACLRLVTLRPELDFKSPSLNSRSTLWILSSAFLEYLAMIFAVLNELKNYIQLILNKTDHQKKSFAPKSPKGDFPFSQ